MQWKNKIFWITSWPWKFLNEKISLFFWTYKIHQSSNGFCSWLDIINQPEQTGEKNLFFICRLYVLCVLKLTYLIFLLLGYFNKWIKWNEKVAYGIDHFWFFSLAYMAVLCMCAMERFKHINVYKPKRFEYPYDFCVCLQIHFNITFCVYCVCIVYSSHLNFSSSWKISTLCSYDGK